MSIQSFRHFMADPVGYLGFHQVQVGSGAAETRAMTTSRRATCTAENLWSEQRMPKQAGPQPRHLDMVHLIRHGENGEETRLGRLKSQLARLPGVAKPFRQFQLINREDDIGFRWLQFTPNTCTYTLLDPAARFIITGPLSGCTIAVGRSAGGQRVMLHANNNHVEGEVARASQEAMINLVCRSIVNVAPAQRHFAVYQQSYRGLGFVFGKYLAGGSWAFHAYGTESGVRKIGEF